MNDQELESHGCLSTRSVTRALPILLWGGGLDHGCGEGRHWELVGFSDDMHKQIDAGYWRAEEYGLRTRTITIELKESGPPRWLRDDETGPS